MDDIVINSELTVPFSLIAFRYSRSGGKGGQNVNKVSTRVELLLRIDDLPAAPELRARIKGKLGNAVDASGILRIVSQESRSQWQNRRTAVEKLSALLEEAMTIRLPRRATKPTKSSAQKRLLAKKIHAVRKSFRSKKSFNDE